MNKQLQLAIGFRIKIEETCLVQKQTMNSESPWPSPTTLKQRFQLVDLIHTFVKHEIYLRKQKSNTKKKVFTLLPPI